MPRKPKSPCRHPGCPELTEARFCPKHMQEYNRCYNRKERPKYSKQLYNSARWQRLRKQVLSEHPLCVECERHGRVTPATIVDHVIPHKGNLELFWDEGNLQPLCKYHHDSKTTKEGRWGDKNKVYSY